MKFVQMIEMRTSRYDDLVTLANEWDKATEGVNTVTRELVTSDRDRPNTYVMIVEFDSYEDAQKNNELPATNEISAKMAELCDEPPVFRNLDLIERRH
ncbi:hypothetical protein [Phytoactinopolyspora endophytica]|uniref:hypothetical protein n=1 Tax=Phytoactinopolyspora endophytica TaxID=1642495 RepID=UPI00101D2A36|nr:hypothetical protein [Phytoactinopolyspora endophytica]